MLLPWPVRYFLWFVAAVGGVFIATLIYFGAVHRRTERWAEDVRSAISVGMSVPDVSLRYRGWRRTGLPPRRVRQHPHRAILHGHRTTFCGTPRLGCDIPCRDRERCCLEGWPGRILVALSIAPRDRAHRAAEGREATRREHSERRPRRAQGPTPLRPPKAAALPSGRRPRGPYARAQRGRPLRRTK